jgi:hypothetical protein
MIATTRASLTTKISAVLACVACATLLAAAAATGAEGTITYRHESLQEYEKQLAANQLKEVTVNKRVASLRVTLKDGSHVLARYGKHQEPAVVAALKARGVPVRTLKPAEALKEVAKKPVHHKLRYIAGGIVIVVVIVVGTVLYIDRKRKRQLD